MTRNIQTNRQRERTDDTIVVSLSALADALHMAMNRDELMEAVMATEASLDTILRERELEQATVANLITVANTDAFPEETRVKAVLAVIQALDLD